MTDKPTDASGGSRPPPRLDRVAALELLGRLAMAANASMTLADAAQAVVDEVCAVTGWPAGRLWLVADSDSPLVATTVAHGQPALVDGDDRGRPNVSSGRPAEVARQSALEGRTSWGPRADAGTAPPPTAALAVPVTVGSTVVAVLEFLTDDPHPDRDLLEVMAAVGEQLARVTEREDMIAALRRSEERLRAGSTGSPAKDGGRDPLTGLADRSAFHARLDAALDRPARGTAVAVLWCDLDRFRAVNDSFGHAVGDDVMAAVAHRLVEHVPRGATVARVGSDEFAVLAEVVDDEVAKLAHRVQETFATPFGLAVGQVWVTASIGVAVATTTPITAAGDDRAGDDRAGADRAGADRLLREAGTALSTAKQRGRGRVEVFDEAMRSARSAGSVTEHELRDAVGKNQLRVRYQPIVELASGEIVGVEALVRWQHPTRGLLPPAEFIPLAEATGLVVPLGRWVLDVACRQATDWQQMAGTGRSLMLTVNVAAQQFSERAWVSEVAEVLARSGLPPEHLVLEITESALMDDTESSAQTLGAIRALGLRLAIDDFGTGYSSLAYLRRMPVDFLKIDKAFVDGVTGDAHESALARALVKLAATLGLTAIAEGIESAEQADVLRNLGCRLAQGLWLGPPEPPEAITAMLAPSPPAA